MGAHHGDVGVGDGQDEGGAEGGGCHGSEALAVVLEVGHGSGGDDGVRGQERRQVSLHSDRAHAGAATSVWDAEGLMQVQVTHVGSDVARGGQPHLATMSPGQNRSPPKMKELVTKQS